MEDFPPPGYMRLLSVEAANNLYTTENLVWNGDFSLWYAGAPAPENFQPPVNPKIVRVNRLEPRGGPGQFAADQHWFISDAEEGLLDLFHTLVSGIQAGRVYELFVQCRVYDPTTVSVSLVLLDASGAAIEYWPEAIVVESGQSGIRKYSVKIQPAADGALAIVPHSNENTTFRARALWQWWRLTESTLAEGETALPSQPFPVG